MKAISWIIIGAVILLGGYFAYQQLAPNNQEDTQLGIYTGSLPCTDCKEIKTTLTLYANSKTLQPSMYLLEQSYVGKNGDPVLKKGKWGMQKGFPDQPNATVYVLNNDQPASRQLYAWKVNEDELKLLNQDQGKITSVLPYSLKRQ